MVQEIENRETPERVVLVEAHFPVEVRRALHGLRALPELDGKNLRDLLGEAINDLCVKYGVEPPYANQTRAAGEATPGRWATSVTGRGDGPRR